MDNNKKGYSLLMPAPYKRGTKLVYSGCDFKKGVVTYKRWWGFQRAALIVVLSEDGNEHTVHQDDVKPVQSTSTKDKV